MRDRSTSPTATWRRRAVPPAGGRAAPAPGDAAFPPAAGSLAASCSSRSVSRSSPNNSPSAPRDSVTPSVYSRIASSGSRSAVLSSGRSPQAERQDRLVGQLRDDLAPAQQQRRRVPGARPFQSAGAERQPPDDAGGERIVVVVAGERLVDGRVDVHHGGAAAAARVPVGADGEPGQQRRGDAVAHPVDDREVQHARRRPRSRTRRRRYRRRARAGRRSWRPGCGCSGAAADPTACPPAATSPVPAAGCRGCR